MHTRLFFENVLFSFHQSELGDKSNGDLSR